MSGEVMGSEEDAENWGFFSTGPPESLRDSGYKNTAYALGELVDNSIEEDATDVDIIMFEGREPGTRRWRIQEIGILDNGNGMSPFQLRCSVRYQDGANQRSWARSSSGGKKMGKFGVGLPQASMSTGKRLDIWSWESGGPENAHWTYWDFNDGDSFNPILEPELKKIPEKWIQSSPIWGDSGTLIVWSDLDRLKWKTSFHLYNNSEFLIGRIYRKMIRDGQVVIKMVAYENEPPYHPRWTDRDKDGKIDDSELHDWEIRSNDPLYLDPKANANDPPVNPAFEKAGETQIWTFEIEDPVTGATSSEDVRFTLSVAKKETRQGHGFVQGESMQGMGGGQPHGNHAVKNMGLSIVRENRELELDAGWTHGKNAAWERWWGAELSFGKGMDHIFDVTNNKQHAQRLNEVSKRDWDYFKEDDIETEKEIRDRLREEDHPTWICLIIKERVTKQIDLIRKQLQRDSIVKKSQRKKRHKLAEKIASDKIKEEREKGSTARSDATVIKDPEEKREALRKQLASEGHDEALVEFLEDMLITSEYDVAIAGKPIDGEAFFSVEAKVGSLIVFLNENHKAFRHLFTVLDKIDTDEEISAEQLRREVLHATAALKVMLIAWARYEDNARGDDLRGIQRIRRTWGRYANDFLPSNDDEYLE